MLRDEAVFGAIEIFLKLLLLIYSVKETDSFITFAAKSSYIKFDEDHKKVLHISYSIHQIFQEDFTTVYMHNISIYAGSTVFFSSLCS